MFLLYISCGLKILKTKFVVFLETFRIFVQVYRVFTLKEIILEIYTTTSA